MFCENCGSRLAEGSKFCGDCGAKTEMQPVEAAHARPAPHPAAPPKTPPAPAPAAVTQTPSADTYTPQPGTEPLSVGQYIVMFLLLCVPILNIILLFIWSFGGSVNPGKRNFARASLILFAISFIFIILGGGVIMGVLEALMR